MPDAFVELHARSAFSFLEGASIPEELAGAGARYNLPAMAIVDRNGVYGAPRFHLAAKKAGIHAHIGSEITCTNGLSYPLLAETRAPNDVYAIARAQFTENELVKLTLTISVINTWNRLAVGFRAVHPTPQAVLA